MLVGRKKNIEKIEEIRLSSELLRINSGYERSEVFLKLFLMGTFLLLLFFYQEIISVLKATRYRSTAYAYRDPCVFSVFRCFCSISNESETG